MHIGISRPPTPKYPVADVDGALVAVHAEKLGFESVFYGEHPVRPIGEPGYTVHAHGVPLFQDTLVMLARASALTTSLTIGSGCFLIPQHHPVLLAKQLASLAHYAGGRLVVGCGVGWSRTQCDALGGNFDRRWAQTVESISIMRRLWSQESAAYQGEFYSFAEIMVYPKPDSEPPILVGAKLSQQTVRRITAVADGWIPVLLSDEALEEGPEYVMRGKRELAEAFERAGRDPATLQITVIARGPQVDGDLEPRPVVGRDLLDRFEEIGVQRVAISLPTVQSEDDVVDALERIAASAL